MQIPTLDLADYCRSGLTVSDRQALLDACQDHGFFLLVNHGRDAEVAGVFQAARAFFSLPREKKLKVGRSEINPLGYYDRELTKRRRDQKEVFDFKTGGHISRDPAKHTRWPDEPASFKPALAAFFEGFTTLSEVTMCMVLEALGFEHPEAQQVIDHAFGASHTSAARLNHYPPGDPVPADQRAQVTPLGDMALHHHTDPGAITLLLQDDIGGLEAFSQKKGWITVEPRPGAIVVNIGDILQVWTNDHYIAGVHRVVPVASDRYSIPFFFQPRFDAQIHPWSRLTAMSGEASRYDSFSWMQYIRGRVTDNYSDIGEADIQVSRFKLG